MSDHANSIEMSPGKTRCALAGIVVAVVAGVGPCFGAASAVRPLAAKPVPASQIHLTLIRNAHVNINGQKLGQEVISSAEDDTSGVCVDPHNASVLRINLDAAVPGMVNASASVGPSIAGLMQTENHTAIARTLDDALADVNAMGLVAANLSR